jgi:hypothetical protein
MSDQALPNRPKIGDIVRDAGTVGGEDGGPSLSDLAGVGALFGQSAAMATASMTLAQALGDRFHLHTEAQVDREFSAPYASVARALILALHAKKHKLVSAFDTSGGAALEAQAAMTLFHNQATLTLLVTDGGATTHVKGRSDLAGQIKDFGANKGMLNDLYAKTDEYLTLLAT